MLYNYNGNNNINKLYFHFSSLTNNQHIHCILSGIRIYIVEIMVIIQEMVLIF